MISATLRAVILTAGLIGSGMAAADSTPPGPAEASALPANSTMASAGPALGAAAEGAAGSHRNGPAAPDPQAAPGMRPESESSVRVLPEHALSTLGALVIGIIGLLWVRRHTAEL